MREKRVHIRLSAIEHRMISQAARLDQRTISDYMRIATTERIRRQVPEIIEKLEVEP